MTETEKKTETEEKILDAALKVFARKGYAAATTRAIAEESGFTEMTLFRKFGTKQNLFDQVMERGNLKIQRTSVELFDKDKYENTRELLTDFVRKLDKFVFENFEFVHLSIREDSSTVKPIVKLTIDDISKYFKERVPNKKLDYSAFGYSLSTFIYSLNIDRYYGRTASFGDFDKSLDNFVDILDRILE